MTSSSNSERRIRGSLQTWSLYNCRDRALLESRGCERARLDFGRAPATFVGQRPEQEGFARESLVPEVESHHPPRAVQVAIRGQPLGCHAHFTGGHAGGGF